MRRFQKGDLVWVSGTLAQGVGRVSEVCYRTSKTRGEPPYGFNIRAPWPQICVEVWQPILTPDRCEDFDMGRARGGIVYDADDLKAGKVILLQRSKHAMHEIRAFLKEQGEKIRGEPRCMYAVYAEGWLMSVWASEPLARKQACKEMENRGGSIQVSPFYVNRQTPCPEGEDND